MTTNSITLYPQINQTDSLIIAGKVANSIAARSVFKDYQERKAKNTLRRQVADLALFAEYLQVVGLNPGDLTHDPQAWQGITWGLIEGFVRWQLSAGYAITSINVRLATIKSYARLALKAGVLEITEFGLIMVVKGYSHKESIHIDEQRQASDMPTRKGAKKSNAVFLTPAQAAQLMSQSNIPQGRRDSLLMCLLLEHGLRVGEIARLAITDFDLITGELRFFRPKVDKTQTHKLTDKTLKAARAYFVGDAPKMGNLWRASASKREGKESAGTLTKQGMTERGLTKRVNTLGQAIGIGNLSAHDCRHYWATQAVRSGTPIDRLQDAGGWSSLVMPLRYVEVAKIANEGVKLE